MDSHDTIEARLRGAEARIRAAAEQAGRSPADVALIAVSKTFDAAAIEPALRAGHTEFGENRVQEAAGKWPALIERHPGVRLHLIGPLQTNKVREAVALFHVIHSLDRERLARELAKEFVRQGRTLEVFVQVNIGEEPQKAGVAPGDAVDFVAQCRTEHGLAIAGLMCIPPVNADPLPCFDRLRELARQAGVASLSMGMSGDYEAAIRCGATHVRVGSAIFGGRARVSPAG